MDMSDYDLTEEMCLAQNLDLKCINPRGQFSTGEKHGDFFPVCTNSTLEVTPYPEIRQKDDTVCSSDAWDTFMTTGSTDNTDDNGDNVVVSSTTYESFLTAATDNTDDSDNVVTTTYDHSFDLTNEKNDGAAFQWTVIDEEQGIIKGRLVFGNVFGWLALGFSNPGGNHNGMNGANILMALPGTNYTTQYGLTVPGMTEFGSDEIIWNTTTNTSSTSTTISVEIAKRQRSSTLTTDGTIINPDGSSVAEYQIGVDGSSFRHWSEPTTVDDGSSNGNVNDGNDITSNNMNVIVTDCFTAMTFQTDNINGKFFNVSDGGIDDLMWAGNSNDYHVGYHGRGHRARFYINWMTGEGTLWTKEDEEKLDDHGGDHGDHHEDDSGGQTNNMMSRPPILTSIVAIVTTATTLFY